MARNFQTIRGKPMVSINGARWVAEWIGTDPNAMPPQKVEDRIFVGCDGLCMISGRKIRPGERWVMAHKIAVIDGGPNRESNIFPALEKAHQVETGRENTERAQIRDKARAARGRPANSKDRPTLKMNEQIHKSTGRVIYRTFGGKWRFRDTKEFVDP